MPFQDTNPDAILKKAKNGWYPIPDDFPPLARGAHLHRTQTDTDTDTDLIRYKIAVAHPCMHASA